MQFAPEIKRRAKELNYCHPSLAMAATFWKNTFQVGVTRYKYMLRSYLSFIICLLNPEGEEKHIWSLLAILIGESSVCFTVSRKTCEIPFLYDENYYDTCINVDNGGVPWCYTNSDKGQWEACNIKSCPNSTGRLEVLRI